MYNKLQHNLIKIYKIILKKSTTNKYLQENQWCSLHQFICASHLYKNLIITKNRVIQYILIYKKKFKYIIRSPLSNRWVITRIDITGPVSLPN